jgi:hypothetical protein
MVRDWYSLYLQYFYFVTSDEWKIYAEKYILDRTGHELRPLTQEANGFSEVH